MRTLDQMYGGSHFVVPMKRYYDFYLLWKRTRNSQGALKAEELLRQEKTWVLEQMGHDGVTSQEPKFYYRYLIFACEADMVAFALKWS